jgi:multiple sugar transport system substrate-binding protein/raffinose/stachyose/melibiose transport system substrate-binding protein
MTHDVRTERELDALVDGVLTGRLDRRAVLRRAAGLGLGAPAIAALLAAGPRGFRADGAAAQGGGRMSLASNQSDPEPRARMEQLVADFQAESGVQVDLTTVNHQDFKTAIRTYLASDEPPDVLTWFAGNRMRFFTERELILPITDVYEQNQFTTKFPEGILAVSQGADGQYYFLPQTYYQWAVYYKPSVFQANGIETPPQTWEEFLAACDTFLAAGIKPITIGTIDAWPAAGWFDYLNMRTNGPEFHVRLTDGKAAYNSPEVKETFRHWAELLEKGAYIDNPTALEWQDGVPPLLEGEAAMYLIGGFITDEVPEDQQADLDFFRFPVINPDVPIGEDAPTDGLFVSAGARNVDQAKAFMAYAGSAEVQQRLAQEAGQIAINVDVPLDIYDEPTQKAVQMLQESDYIAQFYDRDTSPEMADVGMQAFVQFMDNPGDVDQILDKLEAERERIFGPLPTS